MPSLIKKLSRRVPSLPRIPEPSDSSEDDAILQRLGPDRNRIAWSGENTFSAISPPQNGTSESGDDTRPKSPPRGILRGPATRDQGSVENRTVNGGVISRIGQNRPQSSTPTRPRYNRTPVRMTVAGEWALKECENLTTWVNNILKDLGSEPVVDLRKCVGDGVTLVKLAEKTFGKFPEEVDTDINSRQDRVDNLQVCLSHLKSSGVDLTAIDAEDIADGNLKSSLLLIGNIKRKVESDKDSKTKTSTVSRGGNNVAAPKMPGAITLPGGMREPPLGVSDYPMTPQRRTSTHPSDDLIPGILRKEETVPRPQSVPPQPLISMTELSSAGVFQRGAEERRQLYSHNNYSAQLSRGAGPRQQTTVKPSVPTSKPLSNAWSNESQKSQPGPSGVTSVEERLRSLISSPPSEREIPASRSFDDGELIVPFPPQPRNALPGGGNSIHQKYPSIPVHSQSNSYIPSRPNDRAYHGSRAEAILNQPNSSSDYPESSQVHSSYKPGQAHNLANYYDPSYTNHSTHPITIPPGTANQGYGDKTRSKAVTPSVDPGEWGHQRGQDNLGFTRDSSPIRERVLNRDESVSSRGRVADGMRDAWNKLYGGRPSVLGDPRPQQSQHHQNTGNYMDMAAKDSRTNATPPSTLRASPMGQSAQGQGSSPSQLSSSQPSPSSVSFPGLNKPFSENLSGSQHTIGPSSKYPDYSNRPLAGKESEPMEKRSDAFKDPRGLPPKPFPRANSDSTLHEPEASIFDYRNSFSEASSRSVTPPLPPLSNTDSDSSVGSPPLPRASSSMALSSQKTPDVVTSTTHVSSEDKKKRTLNSQIPSRSDKKHSFKSFSQSKFPPLHNNEKMQDSGVLSDVRELGTDSDLPFDIEDTILTVDSIDTEMQTIHDGIQKMHLHGDENFGGMRERLDNLEGLYSEVVRVLGNNPSNARRRWSLASSDTSSLRRPVRKFKASAGNPTSHSRSHHHHKDIKAINRRFQRLESHVVTLARSVAHLSSELRSHNSMVNELESLRKEVRDMKEHQFILSHQTGANGHSSLEHNKGWGPSLTNPKRINKLTQFFGQEPPLMEWFLKNLGYEKFVSNFDAEHIGMLELPYMNEERLEKIGIPMGPRLRILQEAQNCFQHENLNIYIV